MHHDGPQKLDGATPPPPGRDRPAGSSPGGPTDSPFTVLLNVASTIKAKYGLLCGLAATAFPDHLDRPPRVLPGWDGTIDRRESARRSIWLRLARACLRRRVSPFVLLHYHHLGDNDRPQVPPPEKLLRLLEDEGLVDVLRDDGRRSAGTEAKVWLAQWEREATLLGVKRGLDEKAALREALSDPDLDRLPLLHMLGSITVGEHARARALWPRAIQDYLFAKDFYDDRYGKFIPDRLRRAADEVLDLVDRRANGPAAPAGSADSAEGDGEGPTR